MFKFKKKKHKYLLSESKAKTQEFDRPSQLQFFTGMGGTRNTGFHLPEVLKQFINDLDDIVEEFIEKTNPDEYNSGKFMDDYIDNIIDLAQKDLQRQKIEHLNVIYSIRSIEESWLLNYQEEEKQIRKCLEGIDDRIKEDEDYEGKQRKVYTGSFA